MKWSHRLGLVAAPVALAVFGAAISASAASACCCDTVVIAVQPATTQVNTTAPTVVVDIEQSGKIDKSFRGTVTLSYAVNPDGAPLPSGATVSAVKGVATFSGLKFSGVGFGFELKATINHSTSSPASSPFDVVSQLVQCPAGSSCSSQTVSSNGTSGSVVAAASDSSDVLTATGGGFGSLSCGSVGGVLSFSVANRSKVITMTLDHSLVPHQSKSRYGRKWDNQPQLPVCYAAPTAFTTASGSPATFNPANDEFEGTLPACSSSGSQPCIQGESKDCAGDVTVVIDAPAGDPRATFS